MVCTAPYVIRVFVASLLLGWTASCPSAGDGPVGPGPDQPQVVSLDLESQEVTPIPLTHDHVALMQPDGKVVSISVVLEKVRCKFRMERRFRGVLREERGSAMICQLRSTDPSVLYVWAFSNSMPIVGFGLSSSGANENYLGYVQGLAVHFTEVSKPRDRRAAVAEAGLEGASITHVPLIGLIPNRDLGVDAFNAQVRVESVGKDQSGQWVVQISSLVSGNSYTIVGDGKNWHTEPGAGPAGGTGGSTTGTDPH